MNYFKIYKNPYKRQGLTEHEFTMEIYDQANEIAFNELNNEGILENGDTLEEAERNDDRILERVKLKNIRGLILRETATISGYDCGKYRLYMNADS